MQSMPKIQLQILTIQVKELQDDFWIPKMIQTILIQQYLLQLMKQTLNHPKIQ